jgi:hypothetical protein
LNALPTNITLGEPYTVEIQVSSDTKYLSASAMPVPQYPGKYVVFTGPDRAGQGTSTVLHLTLVAKNVTTGIFPQGVPVSFAVGVRFKGGVTVAEWYNFQVSVP